MAPEMVTKSQSSGLCPPAEPNISIREYIYFLPYPLPPGTPVPYSTGLPSHNPLNLPPHQFEPTSTLVLTTPLKTFLDIRLYKLPSPSFAPSLPNTGDSSRLEWGFAGTSSSAPIAKAGWEGVTHSTWVHWVDSRFPVGSPEMPADEGDMYPISPELSLEHGHAYHPSLAAVKSHEEMWRDVAVESTNQGGLKVCAVLRVESEKEGVRGVVVRVGQFVQGLLMHGERVTVERWECDGEEGMEGRGWKRTARIGDGFLPCAVLFRTVVLAVGGMVKYHDFEWVVEEAWEW
ncbi:hypothetical protein ACN47E_005715 [Coniothyrium glycines]